MHLATLTIVAISEGEASLHGLRAAVGRRVYTAGGPLLALACAKADDAVYKSTLGILLLQVVLARDVRDEAADLAGAFEEHRVGCALGQLVNLEL